MRCQLAELNSETHKQLGTSCESAIALGRTTRHSGLTCNGTGRKGVDEREGCGSAGCDLDFTLALLTEGLLELGSHLVSMVCLFYAVQSMCVGCNVIAGFLSLGKRGRGSTGDIRDCPWYFLNWP